jgi:hypothetical protein
VRYFEQGKEDGEEDKGGNFISHEMRQDRERTDSFCNVRRRAEEKDAPVMLFVGAVREPPLHFTSVIPVKTGIRLAAT